MTAEITAGENGGACEAPVGRRVRGEGTGAAGEWDEIGAGRERDGGNGEGDRGEGGGGEHGEGGDGDRGSAGHAEAGDDASEGGAGEGGGGGRGDDGHDEDGDGGVARGGAAGEGARPEARGSARVGGGVGPRVVLVIGSTTGGIGAHVRLLAEGLVRRGARVAVLGPAAVAARLGFTRFGAAFVPVEIAPLPHPATDARTVARVRRHARTADVVHAHGVRAGALSALALTGVATPLVVTLHNAVLTRWPHRVLASALERLAVRRADVVLGASTDLVDHARRQGARDARLGPVAAPPLRAGRSRDEARAALGRALGLTGAGLDRQLVVSIGRLAPQKDYLTLLAAAARLARRPDPPLLAVAGDGPMRAALAERIAAEALPVALLGHRDDVADLLAAADVFVLSSSWEARPLAVQEAMRCGVPVVATAVGGIPDLVGTGAALVPPGDGARLAAAVATLLDDTAARAAQLRAAAEQVAAWPDPDDTVTQVLGVYEELTAR